MLYVLDQTSRHGPRHTLRVDPRVPRPHRQHLVQGVVDCPEVGGPVGVAQSSLEGEQSRYDVMEVVWRETLLVVVWSGDSHLTG